MDIPTIADIERAIKKHTEVETAERKTVKHCSGKEKEWKEKREDAEERLRTAENSIKTLHRNLVILKGPPEDVCALRENIIKNLSRVRRTDLKVSTITAARNELSEQKKRLKEICNHILFTTRSGHTEYREFPDSNGWVPGIRSFLLCGYEEYTRSPRGRLEEYKTLTVGEDRAETHAFFGPGRKDIWTNTDELLRSYLNKNISEYLK